MARRLSFLDFKSALQQFTLPRELLGDYVEFDEDGLRLVFRPDALTTPPGAGFDVDREVLQYTRILQLSEAKKTEAFSFKSATRVLLEGDSWLQLPGTGGPSEMGAWLCADPGLHCINLAHWGHTVASILKARNYEAQLRAFAPGHLVLSAGANDLQQGVQTLTFIKPFDPALLPEQYLTAEGLQALAEIGQGYVALLKDITSLAPGVRVICHGYDYPRPTRKSRFLGRHLQALGIPEPLMQPITDHVIDALTVQLKRSVAQFPNATYVDCRGVTRALTWFDDLHPSSDGFKAVAIELRRQIA